MTEEKVVNKDEDVFENDEAILVESNTVLIFEVPSEPESFLKTKEDFKWTLQLDIFAKFWGLFVMKLPIPDDIWEYVYANKDKMPNGYLNQAISILAGAPIEQDEYVRQMVLGMVMQ